FGLALQQPATPSFKEKIQWYRAWNLRKIGSYQLAAQVLEELRNQTENEYDKARYLFWLARTQRELGDSSQALSTLTKLKRLDPLGYYGLLAHRESRQITALVSRERSLA